MNNTMNTIAILHSYGIDIKAQAEKEIRAFAASGKRNDIQFLRTWGLDGYQFFVTNDVIVAVSLDNYEETNLRSINWDVPVSKVNKVIKELTKPVSNKVASDSNKETAVA